MPAVRTPGVRIRFDPHRKRPAGAGRDTESGTVREQPIPQLDGQRRVRREDRVLGELGAEAEPARRRLHPLGRLSLRVASLDPAQQRDCADDHDRAHVELPGRGDEHSRDRRRGGEHAEGGAADGVTREPARLGVGDDLGDESASPARRLVLRPGRQRARRNDAVASVLAEMIENTPLVRGERHVARRTKPNVEHTGAALFDVDDVARGEVDQGRRHRIVGDAEAVDEEARDGRRLDAEVERPRPDWGHRRHAREEQEPRDDEPSGASRNGSDDEQEIGVDGQTRMVSASADAPATPP